MKILNIFDEVTNNIRAIVDIDNGGFKLLRAFDEENKELSFREFEIEHNITSKITDNYVLSVSPISPFPRRIYIVLISDQIVHDKGIAKILYQLAEKTKYENEVRRIKRENEMNKYTSDSNAPLTSIFSNANS